MARGGIDGGHGSNIFVVSPLLIQNCIFELVTHDQTKGLPSIRGLSSFTCSKKCSVAEIPSLKDTR